MRTILFVSILALVLVPSVKSQDFVAAGASYQQASPNFTGWALYAKPITQTGLYSFSEYDVVPRTMKPFVLDSNVRTGLAQRVYQWDAAALHVCVDAGAATGGSSAGGSFGACGMASWKIGKTNWFVVGIVSGVKNSLSDPTTVYKFGIGRSR